MTNIDLNTQVKWVLKPENLPAWLSADWNTLLNKPSVFPPEAHNHNDLYNTKAEITSLLSDKQDLLSSWVNIKTIGWQSLLWSWDIVIPSSSSLYAKIYAGWSQSVPQAVETKLTWLVNKEWDTNMTAVADQITITETWVYNLNAYCFCWFTANTIFRIKKNWTSISPHIRLYTTSGSTTPLLTAVESLTAWDVLTIAVYHSGWWLNESVQSATLSAIKI